jgi:hypothetical protein
MFSGGMSPDIPTFNSPRDRMRSMTGAALGAVAGARFISAHPDSKLTITARVQSKCSFFMSGLPFWIFT